MLVGSDSTTESIAIAGDTIAAAGIDPTATLPTSEITAEKKIGIWFRRMLDIYWPELKVIQDTGH
jgi:hypothetical protein